MISYFGGKNGMLDFINKFIPRDIKNYCEPFSGAYWTYMNTGYQFPELQKIIYNDFNGHMANLYACLKEHKTFLKYIEKELINGGFLYTEEIEKSKIRDFYANIFYSYKKDLSSNNFLDNPPKQRPDFIAGVKYAFLITSSFNGCYPRSCGCSPISSNNKPKLMALVNKLKKSEYQNKLEKITDIHNEDFEAIIRKYDSPDTYFYLDPPYFSPDEDGNDTGKRASWYGTKDFNYDNHMRLLNLLKTTKSRWSLSYYYFKELEDLLPRDKYVWVTEKFFRSSASFSETKSEQGEELLIMNYKLSDKEIENNKQYFKVSKNKPRKSMAKKNKADKELLNKVVEQIKLDLELGDLEAVYELLNFVPIKNLQGYLPEEEKIVEEIKQEITVTEENIIVKTDVKPIKPQTKVEIGPDDFGGEDFPTEVDDNFWG